MRLELTRRTDYAVRAMLTLARHPSETLSSAEISDITHIPVRFVTQVMSNLVRAGIVDGVIGRTGGYRLVARPEAVSVLSIVEAVEGDTRRQHCVLRGGPCQYGSPCEIHEVFASAQEAFIGQLGASTLASVINRPADGDVAAAGQSAPGGASTTARGRSVSRCSRVVWRGKQPPARDAAD